MYQLIIFYDGLCPLCVKEMEALQRHDSRQQIKLVDIQGQEMRHYPSIDKNKAGQILHAITPEGTVLLGLDVTYRAWKLVGKGWIYAPLRWSVVKPLADWAYLQLARNRYRWSKLLTGKSKCESGQCSR
ncbi:DUF393 domain-containing protein [Vibrio sp. JPW-9-11-11]|uniref:thiol-disulfide oxidoreductase DCC family protein n=1 Tax=Vibrio sp. JPW-9-11-11 TaxID=1416532 RepID=UPI001594A174|nr:DUF393 domain-containing protein [Vibrio sp. JPW-9-11-11]NVD08582.1 DUF393 domain-containing protein [Vibrio sp. JPW-9-11-11]